MTSALGCSAEPAADRGGPSGSKMLVLGMDGLDPNLLRRMMDEGKLPNFSKLEKMGGFMRLGTSMPPQSPVAWSNFISGADPGQHQIYDFVHRRVRGFEDSVNRENANAVVEPYLSTSIVQPDTRWYSPVVPDAIPLPWTNWQFPLEGSKSVSLRRGDSFWNSLIAAGVETTLYRMPANYPPPVVVAGRMPFRCLCGMGTPDVQGDYGQFTAFREDMLDDRAKPLGGGGILVRLDVRDHHARSELEGPASAFERPAWQQASAGDAFLAPPQPTWAPVEIIRDPQEEAAVIRIDQTQVLLKKGEWSDWIPLELRPKLGGESAVAALGGLTRMPAMCRVFLRAVHPNLDVYVSPLNIDPIHPAMPIAAPSAFSAEIAERAGRYYTQGIPEDTKALRGDALDEDEFLQMVRLLASERTRQYHNALEHFQRGFLFFYFGHTDQLSHVFWRDTDPQHPGRKPEQDGKYVTVIEDVYREMDERVAEALAKIAGDDVLMICSDHGFSSFRRGVNVNRWLASAGYLAELPRDQAKANSEAFLTLPYVDWSKTRAYAVGINSIYLNLKGRERYGTVDAKDAPALLAEISQKLLELRDGEADNAQVVVKMYGTAADYAGADPEIAPDLLVGYANNYRASWATVEGRTRQRVIENNIDRWSGDHCIASHLVPGVLLANRRIAIDDPNLTDMATTILGHFVATPPKSMKGRNVLGR
jgi:predicted AlkP superfamily phosphohydrolase/phosphomutase